MPGSQKLKIFFLVILVLCGIYITGAIISPSDKFKYINPPVVNKYSLPNNDLAKRMPENVNKFGLMPIAAGRARGSVVHIALDRETSYKLMPKKSGINIYKPLKKNCRSLGSGVIVSPDGYILTNNHVIENFPGRIRVELTGNESYEAKIIGRDPKTDLAVMKVDVKNLPHLKFGDSKALQVGDIVLAVGNPFGIGESVTMGIISALGRSNIGIVDYEDFIQTDAAINPGNSGGALINLNGELIGINTAILTKSGGYEGIGFAIPSGMAKRIFEEIKKKGKVERGWIGIAIQDIDNAVMIIDVVAGGPADVSGLKREDILLSVNNIPLENKSRLRNIVANSGIDSPVRFKILRSGKIMEIPVKVSKLPDNMNFLDVKSFSFPAR